MTKAELILKIAKSAGIPDTDMKKFFELLLKKISAVIDVGQSLYIKDFGYFNLINGSIKKPIFSFTDNEVAEEKVELVLFSEDKDLKKSDSKGLVFNIPFFDEEDYHPIDSAFSLSIGKPLIPLRGVPFDDIYVPSSGYEYRRLLESKVEKLVSASEISETEDVFPTLVIDARSYSNQVQLQWDSEKSKVQVEKVNEVDGFVEEISELSEYEKQTKELKNIAWDFGEDLSSQIEAESILDITDERFNQEIKPAIENKSEKISFSEEVPEQNIDEIVLDSEIKSEINFENESEIPKEEILNDFEEEDSSAKLDELLNAEPKQKENFEEVNSENVGNDFNEIAELDEQTIDVDFENELTNANLSEQSLPEEIEIKDEPSDIDFWKSTSKYFETYNPDPKEEDKNELEESVVESDSESVEQTDEVNQFVEQPQNEESEIVNQTEEVIEEFEPQVENNNEEPEMEEIELEKSEEQKPEFYEPEKKKNLIPFILFPLLIIVASVALYWYLEIYKKNEISIKPKEIVLKTDNANVISRNFDVPVSYPYAPKEKETTIGETTLPKLEDQTIEKTNVADQKINDSQTKISTNEVKVNEQKPVKIEKKEVTSNTKTNNQNTTAPTGKSLNVGNNIYKYGNNYVVQVAAFRSKTISDNEAGKYRNKGYAAFVETAEIPDRGTWFRVRVGNFSSKEEAIKFLEKNIR